MTLIALGINHTTASIETREKVSFSPTQIGEALKQAKAGTVDEIAILSTCNRTELYCATQNGPEALLHWIESTKNTTAGELLSCHYAHTDTEAVRHMMRVASGLDSLVLGEPQILGQMKTAYAMANEHGALGHTLHELFQQVFSAAKRVRSDTAIGENPVSVAYAAVSLSQQIFSDLKQNTALLIGAGETIELVARHLSEQQIKHLIIANRTIANAQKLASQFDNAEAIALEDIPDHLPRADIVIGSTASPLPILGKGTVEHALKKRRYRPMFMVDIAVPRDIEAQVGNLGDVYLYTVDDLKEVIDANMKSRQRAAEIANDIIDEGVAKYEKHRRATHATDVIKQFRGNIDEIRQKELEKSLKLLRGGGDAEKILTQLARNLSNKFMHQPTHSVRQAASEGNHDVAQHLRELFDIPDNPSS